MRRAAAIAVLALAGAAGGCEIVAGIKSRPLATNGGAGGQAGTSGTGGLSGTGGGAGTGGMAGTGGAAGTSSVLKVDIAGGTPMTVATGTTSNGPIAVDASNVYYGSMMSGGVRTVSLAGGAVDQLAPAMNPSCVLIDGANVYFSDGVLSNGQSLKRVALDGGTPTTIVPGAIPAPASRSMQCVADAAFIYWTSGDNIMAIEK